MIPTTITLDRFDMTVFNSTFAVAIMGDVERNIYELVEVDTRPVTEDALKGFAERNLTFLGVISFFLGEDRPRTVLKTDHEWRAETIRALSRKFLDMLEHALNARVAEQVAKHIGDSVEWLQRLQALPDLRNGMEN